jgi:hypothetical protein
MASIRNDMANFEALFTKLIMIILQSFLGKITTKNEKLRSISTQIMTIAKSE